MNEWLLIIVFVIVLVVPQYFLSRVKQPLLSYIRVAALVLLLVLVWGFSEPVRMVSKVALTGIAAGALLQAIKDYRKTLNPSK